MTLNRARLNWGVFLIVLAGVPLAYNQGAISMDAVQQLWRFWPLVLVGIGLGFVLSRTPAAFIGGLTVAACLGLVFGGLLTVGPEVGCGPNKGPTHSFSRSGTLDGASPSVHLELRCGTARVASSADAGWRLDASVRGQDPTVVSTSNSLTIRQGNRNGWFLGRSEDEWNVALPSGTNSLSASVDAGEAHFNLAGATISYAEFSLNAGDVHLDLTGARVANLTLSVSVGSANLILDGTSDTSGKISNSVGSTDICAPAGLGLRIRYTGSLASDNFADAGLALIGGAWQNPGYAAAAHKADLTIDNSVGSVTLNPAGGCK